MLLSIMVWGHWNWSKRNCKCLDFTQPCVVADFKLWTSSKTFHDTNCTWVCLGAVSEYKYKQCHISDLVWYCLNEHMKKYTKNINNAHKISFTSYVYLFTTDGYADGVFLVFRLSGGILWCWSFMGVLLPLLPSPGTCGIHLLWPWRQGWCPLEKQTWPLWFLVHADSNVNKCVALRASQI